MTIRAKRVRVEEYAHIGPLKGKIIIIIVHKRERAILEHDFLEELPNFV
jgi:hypothetical protein